VRPTALLCRIVLEFRVSWTRMAGLGCREWYELVTVVVISRDFSVAARWWEDGRLLRGVGPSCLCRIVVRLPISKLLFMTPIIF
jgi:hypothetical protein